MDDSSLFRLRLLSLVVGAYHSIWGVSFQPSSILAFCPFLLFVPVHPLPSKNFALGAFRSDDCRLGGPVASPFTLVHFVSSLLRVITSPCLLEGVYLVGDIGPVWTRYFLLHFLEQVREVVQAADRCAPPVLLDRGVLAQGTQQNGALDVGQRDPAIIERQSQFLIGSGEATLDTAALEKQTFHFLHIASRLVAGGGIARASVRPEVISNLEDAVAPESTDTLLLKFLEGKIDIALGFAESCLSQWLGAHRLAVESEPIAVRKALFTLNPVGASRRFRNERTLDRSERGTYGVPLESQRFRNPPLQQHGRRQ